MSAIEDTVQEVVGNQPDTRLNSLIAILVALTATVMAICNIKDGNVTQAMSQAQASSIDSWSFYQSKSTKQAMVENLADQLEFQVVLTPAVAPEVSQRMTEKLRSYHEQAARYEKEKAEIKVQAEGFTQEYTRLNVHDDQFDMAEACFSVSLALYGITALTRKNWLLVMAGLVSLNGLIFGLAGFLGWSLHPDWLAKLLG